MSFDAEAYQKAMFGGESSEAVKQAFGARSTRFAFLQPKHAADGQYQMRFLPPHPDRAPEGWVLHCSHWIRPVKGTKSSTNILCPAPDELCALCKLLSLAVPLAARFTSDLTDAFSEMMQRKRLNFPISIFADVTEKVEGERKTVTFKPGTKEVGGIFQVESKKLKEEIGQAFALNSDLAHHKRGRYLTFSKARYDYRVFSTTGPEPLKDPEILKDYPDLPKILFAATKRYTFNEQVEALRSCWWASDPMIAPLFAQLGASGVVQEEDEDPFSETVLMGSARKAPAVVQEEEYTYSDDIPF